MLFQKKKSLPSLLLMKDGETLYDGLLKDVPLKEEIILKKSVEFFDDPEPCHIHRSAVRVRLISELLEELTGRSGDAPGPLVLLYVDAPKIDFCRLIP